MYKAIANQNKEYQIGFESGVFTIEGQTLDLDISVLDERRFHLLFNNKSYNAEVLSADSGTKTFEIKVNGLIHSIKVKDKFDQLLEQLGMSNANASKVNDIKAPMPGLILDIHVKEGDTVEKGDPIMVLEAMKMENVIKSPGSGEVKSLKVNTGESVEKNQVLIQF